jgi:methionyl aminopeptidase
MAMTRIKSSKEIEDMRTSGQILAKTFSVIKDSLSPGMTTNDIDIIAKKELRRLGGQPILVGYQGFPKSICVSLNEEVVHGIPSDKIIEKGDLVSVDFCVSYKGMITDSAFTQAIECEDPKQIIANTEKSLFAGIDVVRDGAHVGDIGQAVAQVLEASSLGIVRDLVGHGVGHEVHEEPNIPNYGRAGRGVELKSGMTIAIEPMSTLGGYDVVILDDGWTIKTRDNSLSAHFEHTVLVTDNSYEIITALPDSES